MWNSIGGFNAVTAPWWTFRPRAERLTSCRAAAWGPNPGSSLWYDKPSEKWTDALPLGNGRLGAMVFGGTDHERIALNEDTLYSGEPPADLRTIDIRKDFAHVQELLRTGD